MRSVGAGIVETLLLFGALAFCIPPIPSHTPASLPLFPGAAIALALFAGSRALRWRSQIWFALAETLLFGGFVFLLNKAANLLYNG